MPAVETRPRSAKFVAAASSATDASDLGSPTGRDRDLGRGRTGLVLSRPAARPTSPATFPTWRGSAALKSPASLDDPAVPDPGRPDAVRGRVLRGLHQLRLPLRRARIPAEPPPSPAHPDPWRPHDHSGADVHRAAVAHPVDRAQLPDPPPAQSRPARSLGRNPGRPGLDPVHRTHPPPGPPDSPPRPPGPSLDVQPLGAWRPSMRPRCARHDDRRDTGRERERVIARKWVRS